MSTQKLISAVVILTTNFAAGAVYRTSYLQFELPSRWECTLEQTEYVCSSSATQGKKDAVIVFTAKEKGPSDSLSSYEQHLKTPRTVPNDKGVPQQSKIIKVQKYQVLGHEWVDGFHDSSELYNYYTRYLATVKDNLGILITFSAHRKSYSKYSQDFDRAIRSLQVLRVTAAPSIATGPIGTGAPSGPIGPGVPSISTPLEPEPITNETSDSSNTTFLGMVLLILAVVGYLMLRRKK